MGMSGRSCGNGGNSSHWAAIIDSQRRGHSSEPGNPSRRAWFVPKWPNMCTHIHRLIPRMELNMVIHMFTHVYLHRIVSMGKNAAKSASRTVLRSAASAVLCCAAQRMLHSGAPGNKHGLAPAHAALRRTGLLELYFGALPAQFCAARRSACCTPAHWETSMALPRCTAAGLTPWKSEPPVCGSDIQTDLHSSALYSQNCGALCRGAAARMAALLSYSSRIPEF